jgi:hypothetical protein
MDDLADDPADRAFGFARLKAMPRNSRPGVPLTQQPVDEAGRCAGQAERQRHTHQHLVAIDWGWWGAQRIDPRAQSFQHETGKTCRGRPVPHLWGIPADLRCFGSLTPKRQCRAVGEIIKIVMIQ